jgi:hypothetical protein
MGLFYQKKFCVARARHTPFGRSVRHKEPGAELLEMAAKFNPFWNVQ